MQRKLTVAFLEVLSRYFPRDWKTLRTYVRMVGTPAWFWIEHLPNMSRKIQRLPHLVFFVYLRLNEYPWGGAKGVSGAARGNSDYSGDYWTATGGSKGLSAATHIAKISRISSGVQWASTPRWSVQYE